MSTITIVGNLTDEPELRFTPSGAALVKFSVAVNRRTFDRQKNEWTDAGTDFHRVTAWRALAENIAASLSKGSRVIVEGDLQQRHWVDQKTNEKRSAWELNAFTVGADLTWASVAITKTAAAAGRQSAPDDPWNTSTTSLPANPAGDAFLAGVGAPAAGGYSDEPPF
jgi:single-strand DNA-binding protein